MPWNSSVFEDTIFWVNKMPHLWISKYYEFQGKDCEELILESHVVKD